VKTTCKHCGSRAPHKLLGRGDPPFAALAFGGPVFALFLALARKRRFRCADCGAVFFAHTLNSRIFVGVLLFMLLLLVLRIIAAFLPESWLE
jgi:DNA-directed RNA polymerase subunit RPC12/RpoP